MALKHWARDALRAEDFAVYAGNQEFGMLIQYHMLRTAGFEWIWECDGEVGPNGQNPNHCDDGNMEGADTSKWPFYGTATVTKDTVTVRSGTRSLKVVAGSGSGNGVQSAALLNIGNPISYSGSASDSLTGPDVNGVMTLYDDGNSFGYNHTNSRMVCSGFSNSLNNGTFLVRDPAYAAAPPNGYLKFFNDVGVAQVNLTGASVRFDKQYCIAIWALIGSGLVDGYWKVEVDPGDGTFIELGQLALGDDWQLNLFTFYAVGTGSRYVRITDTYGSRTCYIDGVHVFRAVFEFAPDNVYDATPSSPKGVLTNPDQFSVSTGYTPGKKDVGKWLFVWDDNHNKNTGFYKIIADLGGGVVQVSMRSGSATFTSSGVGEYVNWRIVDVDAQAHNCWDLSCNYVTSIGFGLQSPHSSHWRYFSRINHYYTSHVTVWAAPDDEASFDFSTGQFYGNGPSTQLSMQLPYKFGEVAQRHHWLGEYSSGSAPTTRNWLMTDQDRSFIFFIHRGVAPNAQHNIFFIGYTGADPDHPGIEEFAMLMPWNTHNYGDITFDTSGFGYVGVGFSPGGVAVPTVAAFIGWQNGSTFPLNISNAGPNAWSGREWLLPLIIVRDPNGSYGCFSQRDSSVGLFLMRSTGMTAWTTFDSNAVYHVQNEFAMEWNGESVIA